MYTSHQKQKELRECWRTYLCQFDWQWAASLTFDDGVDFFRALDKFKYWRRLIMRKEKIRVAAQLMSSYKQGRIHFHVLLIGKNRKEKTLLDMSTRKWEREYKKVTGSFAKIEPVYDRHGASDYLAVHFMGFKSDRAQTECFDINLLYDLMDEPHEDWRHFPDRL